MLKLLYNFTLSAASAVALNLGFKTLNEDRRYLFFYSFKIKFVKRAVMYVLYTFKLKRGP